MSEASSARYMQGVALGLAATLSWALYNVGTAIGRADGFSSADLAMLRYGVAALVLLPFLVPRLAVARAIGWRRLLLLTAMIGPPFALFINAGYGIAPLSHAVVISPGVTMLVANALAILVDRRRMPLNRRIGMALLVAGLIAIAVDQPDIRPHSDLPIWLGDLCFVASGTLWGVFTWLVGRWHLPPVETTGAISILSALAFLPVHLFGFGVTPMPAALWLEQAVYQGILGGALAIVAFAGAVVRLGTGTAALFPALLPPAAILVGVVIADSVPSLMALSGIALATCGLAVSLDFRRRVRSRAGDSRARTTDGA
ncbi:DMT family transporter [Aquamicrobium sp. LC103]|uniref:DMT family transporter n=1 Tax=Aquamicrobium sp. LC103 TaxID=1120658 RepID=UPI00063EA191|nr:DMT family transporter [Aquamicrobium sp. LC103]TKT78128.1 DMT family transporter [Aquamicrobium sp. LC103]